MRLCPQCGAEYPEDALFCQKDGASLTADGGVEADLEELPALLQPGATLDKYRIEEVLGVGGMGVVYRAKHVTLGREVALKMLKPERAVDARVVKRFFSEAKAANAVGHENIIEISDFVETGPHKYYVMELLSGQPVSLAVREGAFDPVRTLHVALQMADALAAVHDAGIVHRDLKPDNIYLTTRARQSDFVKILDFGVAKLGEDLAGDGMKSTQAGVLIGTPAYMAPEQLEGRRVDQRADIYSFGAVVFEMLCARRVFIAKTLPELMLKHVSAQPDPPSQHAPAPQAVPPQLDAIVLRCLAKSAADRPQSFHEIVEQLMPLYEGNSGGFYVPTSGEHSGPNARARSTSGPAVPAPGLMTPSPETMPGLGPPPAPARKLSPVMLIAGGAAMLGLGAAVGLGLLVGGSDPEPEAPAVIVKPVEVKDPAPAPKVPASVVVSVTTTPPGAEVYVGLELEPRGETPGDIKLERAEGEVELHLRLDGYEVHTHTLSPTADARIDVKLDKTPPKTTERKRATKPTRGKKTKKPRRKARKDLVNPFGS
jgi:serine/threonine-protein kinase